MSNWIRRKLIDWLMPSLLAQLQVGGWCGLCGAWMEHELVPFYWPYSVCDKHKETP